MSILPQDRNAALAPLIHRIAPRHPTPLTLRTHTSDPVPFLLFSSDRPETARAATAYDEEACARTGVFVAEGHTLFGSFVEGTL